jgi:signal transduction histidine kinase/HAMP domain-containing protein
MRASLIRTAVIAALLIALVIGAASAATWRIERGGEERIEEELTATAGELERRIVTIRRTLDSRLERLVEEASGAGSRAQLFAAIESLGIGEAAGIHITNDRGEVLAWWGEYLPFQDCLSFCFDATSVYVARSARWESAGLPLYAVAFERVPLELTSPETHRLGWFVAEARLHGGELRSRDDARQYLLAREGDAALYADLVPADGTGVIPEIRAAAWSAASITLAVMFLLFAWDTRAGGEGPARLLLMAALVVAARVALLGIDVTGDPWEIFGFSAYASKAIGPLARSPFDFVLTAVTIAVVARLLIRAVPKTWRWIASGSISGIGAVGVTFFVRNLVENSRISPMVEHIAPETVAQGFLMVGLVVLILGLFESVATVEDRRGLLLAILASGAVGIVAMVALRPDPVMWRGWVLIAGAVILLFLVRHAVSGWLYALPLIAMLAAMATQPPVALFEQTAVRQFIARTYAPLMAGEGGQLLSMIHSSLETHFTDVELAEILPDEPQRMDLGDLAFFLWTRSDLSSWQIPSAIVLKNRTSEVISRFGVGLPQFASGAEAEGELRLGALSRELLRHEFVLLLDDARVGIGEIYIVNPLDPGATTVSDVYRDLYQPVPRRGIGPLETSFSPVVFEIDGTSYGRPFFRLQQSPLRYVQRLSPTDGLWVKPASPDSMLVYLRRVEDTLFAFPLPLPTTGELLRKYGSAAVWAALLLVVLQGWGPLRSSVVFAKRFPWRIGFQARWALLLSLMAVVPVLLFVLLIRAYVADRLEKEFVDRGQESLSSAQRVIEDYLASKPDLSPAEALDDEILTWLARVVGHDLHLYQDERVIASSRRDLFSARVDAPRLPGRIYAAVVFEGAQLVLDQRRYGPTRFFEIYSPIFLAAGEHYTLALPLIVQGRQIRQEVDDLATTIYLVLLLILVAALLVANWVARSVSRPVRALVTSARAVGRGEFDSTPVEPRDPELGLLVRTFREMAQSIRGQQEQLRYERDKLRTLLENIDSAVVVIEEKGTVVATNAAARVLFGESLSRREELPVVLEELFDRPTQPEGSEVELEIDGQMRTFHVALLPLPEGSERMLIAEDVTEILRSNRLQAWTEMARQVAHEIKNPLTPIQLAAEHLRALAERGDSRLPDVLVRTTDSILRQVETLRETARDFSDYASLKAPRLRDVSIPRLLREIEEDYRGGENESSIDVEIDDSLPELIRADERMLRGVLANVIENARQASTDSATIRITARERKGMAEISICDDGPGVPEALLTRIFEPYFSTRSAGTGLGLAIARKAIEDHGGRIRAENLGPGLMVSIEIPIHDVEKGGDSGTPDESGSRGGE